MNLIVVEDTHENPERHYRDPRATTHRCYLLQESPRVVIEISGFTKKDVDEAKSKLMETFR